MKKDRVRFWEDPEVVDRFADRDPDVRLAALLDAHPNRRQIRALDLGCAGGRNTVLLAESGCDGVAVDASAAMVERTRERLAPILGRAEARRRVRLGRMDDLGWSPPDAFDLVVALGVYHCAESRREWRRAVAESIRVLREDGTLLLSVFTPRTDLSGHGATPVAGEPDVFEGLPGGGRSVLLDAPTVDREMARLGLEVEAPTETVTRELEVGRRVTVNGRYRKRRRP